jgi:hypothetical protein
MKPKQLTPPTQAKSSPKFQRENKFTDKGSGFKPEWQQGGAQQQTGPGIPSFGQPHPFRPRYHQQHADKSSSGTGGGRSTFSSNTNAKVLFKIKLVIGCCKQIFPLAIRRTSQWRWKALESPSVLRWACFLPKAAASAIAVGNTSVGSKRGTEKLITAYRTFGRETRRTSAAIKGKGANWSAAGGTEEERKCVEARETGPGGCH